MKRTIRFVVALALLFGVLAMGQSAMTGACNPGESTQPFDCPN